MDPSESKSSPTPPEPQKPPRKRWERRKVAKVDPPAPTSLEGKLDALASLVGSLAETVAVLVSQKAPLMAPSEIPKYRERVAERILASPQPIPAPSPEATINATETPPGYTDQEWAEVLRSPLPTPEQVFRAVNDREIQAQARHQNRPRGPRTAHGLHDHDMITGELIRP